MIEGITTIELTDVKTGEKEKIESKNMVTNAFKDAFKNPTLYDKSSLKWLMPYYYNFYGGIACLDSSIQEDADNYLLPFNVDVIASGGIGIKNSSDDMIRGSYNNLESEVNEEEKYVKYVYDFTTQQGNGIIRSVCLTSRGAGLYFGLGFFQEDKVIDKYVKFHEYENWSERTGMSFYYSLGEYRNTSEYGYKYHNLDYNMDINTIIPKKTDYSNYSALKPFNFDIDNDKFNYLIFGENFDYDHDTIINHKFYFELHTAYLGLKNTPSFTDTNFGISKNRDINTPIIFSIDIKNDIVDKFSDALSNDEKNRLIRNNFSSEYHIRFFFDKQNNKLHFIFNAGYQSRKLFHYILDLNNNVLEFQKHINATSDLIPNRIFSWNTDFNCGCAIDNMGYFCANDDRFYKINFDNFKTETVLEQYPSYHFVGYDHFKNIIILSEQRQAKYCQTSIDSWTSVDGRSLIYYNPSNDQIKRNLMTPNYSWGERLSFDENNRIIVFSSEWSKTKIGIAPGFRKDYLATINNLPEPIEKTQDKTMKITYTLREV